MAQALLSAVTLYLLLGLAVAALIMPFLGRLDHAARGSYAFRLLLVPGAVLLWPLLIWGTLRALERLKQEQP